METYEQKYKEIVKRIKELHAAGNSLTKKQMEIILPELIESEDERIRKEIIEHFKKASEERDAWTTTDKVKGWLAWLEKQKKQKPVEWSEDENRREGIIQWLRKYQEKFNPEYDSLSIESIESLITWFRSFQLQPKQEWSEEDEHRRNDAIYFLETAKKHYADTSELDATISWLKSLQLHWKPSEKQMNFLEAAISEYEMENRPIASKVLKSLYEDLKKL